jgi:hypothetical protein
MKSPLWTWREQRFPSSARCVGYVCVWKYNDTVATILLRSRRALVKRIVLSYLLGYAKEVLRASLAARVRQSITRLALYVDGILHLSAPCKFCAEPNASDLEQKLRSSRYHDLHTSHGSEVKSPESDRIRDLEQEVASLKLQLEGTNIMAGNSQSRDRLLGPQAVPRTFPRSVTATDFFLTGR